MNVRPGSPIDDGYAHELAFPGGRLRPILRLAFYAFFAPAGFLSCGIATEVRLGGGYGTVYPGSIVAILAASLLMVRFADRRPLRSFGLAPDWWALRDVAIGCLIPAVQLLAILGVEVAMGWTRVVSFAWDSGMLGLALQRWAAVAWTEELAMRGYLFQCLERLGGRRLGVALALALTSVGFGLAHGDNPNASPVATVALAVSGLEYAVAYLVTRRFWLPIAMHFAWNLVEGTVLGYPVSGMARPSLLTLDRSGPDAWTGGAFGPEGGYLSPTFSLVDIAVLCWLARVGFWKPEVGPVEAERRTAEAEQGPVSGIRFIEASEDQDGSLHTRQAGSETDHSRPVGRRKLGVQSPDLAERSRARMIPLWTGTAARTWGAGFEVLIGIRTSSVRPIRKSRTAFNSEALISGALVGMEIVIGGTAG